MILSTAKIYDNGYFINCKFFVQYIRMNKKSFINVCNTKKITGLGAIISPSCSDLNKTFFLNALIYLLYVDTEKLPFSVKVLLDGKQSPFAFLYLLKIVYSAISYGFKHEKILLSSNIYLLISIPYYFALPKIHFLPET